MNEHIDDLVTDCETSRYFRENSTEGSVCLLKKIYPSCECRHFGKTIHLGLEYYKACNNLENEKEMCRL